MPTPCPLPCTSPLPTPRPLLINQLIPLPCPSYPGRQAGSYSPMPLPCPSHPGRQAGRQLLTRAPSMPHPSRQAGRQLLTRAPSSPSWFMVRSSEVRPLLAARPAASSSALRSVNLHDCRLSDVRVVLAWGGGGARGGAAQRVRKQCVWRRAGWRGTRGQVTHQHCFSQYSGATF